MKKFLIYGAGAIGQALGCMLAAAGHQIDLIIRERFIESIRERGLKVTGVLGEYQAGMENVNLYTTLQETEESYDFAVITTKSYDTAKAVRDIAALSNRAAMVVSIQNGCGNLEMLEAGFGVDKCLGGRIISGFEIVAPGAVEITVSADAIHLGGSSEAVRPAASSLAEILTEAGHPAEMVGDIHQSLFAKLLYNCALNPLGAILGVHYGLLAEREETRKVMNSVLDETFQVIKALGGRLPWNHADQYKQFFYSTLIPATYNHRPSMLQDIEAGKPTEVDSLIGFVSNKGRLYDVATPSCDLLANLIRFKESQLRR